MSNKVEIASPATITTFSNGYGIAAYVGAIEHTFRIAGFYHFQQSFDASKKAFKILYQQRIYWAGVDERHRFIVTSEPGSGIPERLVEELTEIAERAIKGAPRYHTPSPAERAKGIAVTFKAGHWK